MTNASRYNKTADRWANELWNVSLLPAAPANETGPRLRKLEIVDDKRSDAPNGRALLVGTRRESDILA